MISLLVGTVASGKSSYAKNAAACHGAIVVNDDAIVSALHGGQYELYADSLQSLYKSVENHIVSHAVALGRDVVVDRGNNNKVASRRRWVGLAHSLNVPIQAIVFPFVDADTHAKRRALHDDRGLSEKHWRTVAERHINEFVEPTVVAEGFDRVVRLTQKELEDYYL